MNPVQDWFDSPLYETLYAHRDDEEARQLSTLIARLYPPEEYTEVLDLACGRGRHTLNLARLGYGMTGLDLSPRATHIAKERLQIEGHSARFFTADMRFPLPYRFNGIVNLFTSFGYFERDEDNITVLSSIRAMLKPGGFLVMDFLNAECVRNTLVPDETGTLPGMTYSIRRFILGDMVHKEIEISREGADPMRFREQVKLLDADWFRKQLHAKGFKIQALFGDYDGGRYDASGSPRLIISASL